MTLELTVSHALVARFGAPLWFRPAGFRRKLTFASPAQTAYGSQKIVVAGRGDRFSFSVQGTANVRQLRSAVLFFKLVDRNNSSNLPVSKRAS